MKNSMRGNKIRRGVSLLLMMSLLITLLPIASAAAATVGAYGSCTVTSKNVVIRTSPAGSRTGYFAQKGTYPMIGPVQTVDGVNWYNIQTSDTGGFVSGDYATASYGSSGMPSTEKTYVDILAVTEIILGEDPANPLPIGSPTKIDVPAGSILQLVNGTPYNATVGGTTGSYINVYYFDGTSSAEYHTPYTNNIANGVMTQDNLNNHIYSVTWQNSGADTRKKETTGDYLTHAIQAALNVVGDYDSTIDGSFGDLTELAVISFQTKDTSLTNDGTVGPDTYAKLFPAAIAAVNAKRADYGLGGSTPGGGTPTVNMIQTTVNSLRVRRSYTTSSTILAMIEQAGTVLTYTRTQVNGSVTWYYIQYQGTYGWVMGTYVTPYTSTGGGTPTPVITNYGTVTITKKLTAIRKTPNGARTGYSVNTGDVCAMIGPAVQAGGYTWYHIRTENGRTGYVRGDCATPNFGSAGMPSTDKKYVQFLYDNMEITKGSGPATAGATIPVTKNTILQLATGTHFNSGGVDYINVFYDNEVYYTAYTNALVAGLMSEDNTNNYIADVVWAQPFVGTEIAGKSTSVPPVTLHTGDIRVHAIQAALYQLGLYDDKMDGMFGDKTAAGVIKFKQNNTITTPAGEIVNTAVSTELFTQAKIALIAKLTAASGDGTVPGSGNFGTVNIVKKGSWTEIDGTSKSLFAKGSTVTVMSVNNPKLVFRLYRWSGSRHADVVPYDTSDTAALCSVVGFTYNSSRPSSTQLNQIKADWDDGYPLHTWPDFRNGFGSGSISGTKEKIPVWVNLNGTVYCASLYVIPHGYDGVSGFSTSKINNQYYHERNNMYGMMCLHFFGSLTHGSNQVDPTHANNINIAYNNAAAQFGASKVK